MIDKSSADDLFKLEEDAMIIDAPVPVSEPSFGEPVNGAVTYDKQEIKLPVYEYNEAGDLSIHE